MGGRAKLTKEGGREVVNVDDAGYYRPLIPCCANCTVLILGHVPKNLRACIQNSVHTPLACIAKGAVNLKVSIALELEGQMALALCMTW